jgi:hypothetical protein
MRIQSKQPGRAEWAFDAAMAMTQGRFNMLPNNLFQTAWLRAGSGLRFPGGKRRRHPERTRDFQPTAITQNGGAFNH